MVGISAALFPIRHLASGYYHRLCFHGCLVCSAPDREISRGQTAVRSAPRLMLRGLLRNHSYRVPSHSHRSETSTEECGCGRCLILHCASAAAEPPARAVLRNPSGRSRHKGLSAGRWCERCEVQGQAGTSSPSQAWLAEISGSAWFGVE